jgi:hypothetical protein
LKSERASLIFDKVQLFFVHSTFFVFCQFIKKKRFFKKLNVKPLMAFKSESSAAPFKFSVCQKRVTLAEPGRLNQPQNVAIRIHLLSANDPQGGKREFDFQTFVIFYYFNEERGTIELLEVHF